MTHLDEEIFAEGGKPARRHERHVDRLTEATAAGILLLAMAAGVVMAGVGAGILWGPGAGWLTAGLLTLGLCTLERKG